ncbi:MAG: formate/nitrite transporter family protein [Eggerthellaceae bacterium]
MSIVKEDLLAIKPDCLAPAATEAKAEGIAEAKCKLEPFRCFVLAILAGMFIGCGALFMTYVKSDAGLGFAAASVGGAACFSLGLILVVVAGAELFTGNNLMVMGALSGKVTWGAVLKNWVIVWVGNFVGSLILVGIVAGANSAGMNGGEVGSMMMTVAAGKISLPASTIIFRGIMCNFLVCLAVWMGFAGKTVIDKIFTCMFPVTAFVAMGFEHCVANMFFLPMGIIAKSMGVAYTGSANIDVLTWGGALYNIGFATLGNLIGGAIFVGVLYWLAYAKRTKKEA